MRYALREYFLNFLRRVDKLKILYAKALCLSQCRIFFSEWTVSSVRYQSYYISIALFGGRWLLGLRLPLFFRILILMSASQVYIHVLLLISCFKSLKLQLHVCPIRYRLGTRCVHANVTSRPLVGIPTHYYM